MHVAAVAALAALTAAIGTVGGIGGAVLLVPVLVIGGLEPAAATPLGLLAVAAGSVAAGPRQIDGGLVHHRLGVTLEVVASAGAVGGAAVVGIASESTLRVALGVIAVGAAVLSVRQVRDPAPPAPAGFAAENAGEWPGTLGGTIDSPAGVVAYQARRLPVGLGLSGVAGFVAGLSGTSGGFVKTPVMSQVMGVPVKVAAATTTFVAGITAAAGLIVHLGAGQVDPRLGAGAILGALGGGWLGAAVQGRANVRVVGLVLAGALAGAGVALVASA